ncbi:hypothetical protein D8S78_02820 [Natrialba swarupiae]|nr:hypothetical protein [Natrialba swarupiae]
MSPGRVTPVDFPSIRTTRWRSTSVQRGRTESDDKRLGRSSCSRETIVRYSSPSRATPVVDVSSILDHFGEHISLGDRHRHREEPAVSNDYRSSGTTTDRTS